MFRKKSKQVKKIIAHDKKGRHLTLEKWQQDETDAWFQKYENLIKNSLNSELTELSRPWILNKLCITACDLLKKECKKRLAHLQANWDNFQFPEWRRDELIRINSRAELQYDVKIRS